MSRREEEQGVFFMNNTKKPDLYVPENEFLNEIQREKDRLAEEKLRADNLAQIKKEQDELKARLDTLRLMPLHANIMIMPYKSNPYKEILSESGIITSWEGSFKNTDSGENDNLEELIKYGKVLEVGPLCKEVQVGDDMLYDTRSTRPVPFMNKGYYIIAESNALLIINDNIKERFNHVQ